MGSEAGRVARLRERVVDLERQLAEAAGDRRRREAEALAQSARFLTETLDTQTVGGRIVQSVCELFDVTAAGLRLREPDGSLVLVASSEGDGLYMPLGHVAPPSFGFYRHVVDAGQPLRAPDLLAAPDITLGDDVVQRLRESRKRSLLAVPLRVQERITGVLSIVAATGRVFTDDEVTLLQTFADLAALALENSRSRAEVERRRREAEELAHVAGLVGETADLATVGERIAEAVLRLLDVDSSAVRLLQSDGSLVAVALGGRATAYAGARAVVMLGAGLIGRAAAEGHPMWTADFNSDERFETSPELRERNAAAGIVAGLAVPMRVAATVTGVLSVGSSTARSFSEREIALLQAFADQAAITISNAQAREALARQAERLRILHEIDRALIAEQAPAAIAEAVVRPLRELLNVPRVIVNLFDLVAGEVEWLAAAGPHRVRLGPGVRYSIKMAGDVEALQRGEPQTIDIRTLPTSADAQALLAAGLNLYMVVPMVVGSELVGSVSVCDTAGPFPPERVAIAQEVATQLGIAIAQARLHERVRRQAAELEQRVDERTRELSVATAEADHANRAKSEFLSRMSHELRTPLNAVLGFAQLLEMEALSERQGESVGHILRAGRHLLGLINEVLDISRIEAGRLELSLEPVPLRETLDQAMQLVRPAAAAVEVTVHADAVDDGLHVLADRQRLHQVLLNLLSNAIKYNRPRGTVRVVSARSADDRLRIAVTDSGEGNPRRQARPAVHAVRPAGCRGQRGRGHRARAGAVEGARRGDGGRPASGERAGHGQHVLGGADGRAAAGGDRRGRGARRRGAGRGAVAGAPPDDPLHRGQPLEPAPRRAPPAPTAGCHRAVGDAGTGRTRPRPQPPARPDPARSAPAGHRRRRGAAAAAGRRPDGRDSRGHPQRGRDPRRDPAVPRRRGPRVPDETARRPPPAGRGRRGTAHHRALTSRNRYHPGRLREEAGAWISR